jgi:hypothetical protein
VKVSRVLQGGDCSGSYLILVRGRRRLRLRILVTLILGATALAGCGQGSQPDDSDRWKRAGPWAEPPAEVVMPAAAPDDPGAYAGVRFRIGSKPDGMPQVEAVGQAVPYLQTSLGPSYGSAGGPLFGYQQMADGRRRMVWFFRFIGPALGTSHHEGVVLDVLELPGETAHTIDSGFRSGCAFDPVILHGDNTWRLNQTSGRFESVDRNKVRCPKD